MTALEASKIERLESMILNIYFSPPESQTAAELRSQRLHEESLLVQHVEDEERTRLNLLEEVTTSCLYRL